MKQIAGFSKYSVTQDGVVYGPRGHVIAPHYNKGMLAVKIHNDAGKRIAVPIHRAVADAYIDGVTGLRVRHKDGDVTNNRIENLEVYEHRSTAERKRALRAESSRRYAKNHHEKVKAVGAKWRKENPARSQALVRARQARKLSATPPWANMDAIERHYANAVYLSEITGHKHHVDHIIPLRGKLVCGLHVENNLRAIPHFLNTRKGNNFVGA